MGVVLTDEQRERAMRLLMTERARQERLREQRRERSENICVAVKKGTKARIRAVTDETLTDFIDRVVTAELQRLEGTDNL